MELHLTPEQAANLRGNCPDCGRVHVTLVERPGNPIAERCLVGGVVLLLVLGYLVEVRQVEIDRYIPAFLFWPSMIFFAGLAVFALLLQAGIVGQLCGLCREPRPHFCCTQCGRIWKA